jgi:hypothetical protein
MADKIRIRIIGFQPDTDQFTGQQYTQIIFGTESRLPSPPPQMQQQTYPPIPKAIGWKHVMHLMIPNTKWKNQYQMWQEYDMTIDENTGEMSLQIAKEES